MRNYVTEGNRRPREVTCPTGDESPRTTKEESQRQDSDVETGRGDGHEPLE